MDESDEPADGDDRDLADWNRAVMAGYDDLAEDYDAERDPSTEIPLVESLVTDLDDDARLLDVGCGGGRAVLETLGGDVEAVGLDVSAAQLALASERAPRAALVRGDGSRLPFAADAFDAVTALHSVIHVPREHHDRLFAEFGRVCRPGGALLVTAGAGPWEGETDDWLGGGAAMRWSFHGADRSRELLRDAGFRIDDDAVRDDELGGGEWLFLRATREG